MAAKKKAPRARTVARKLSAEQAKNREKLYEARRQLAALDAGGSPERPLDVTSASVIEARAEAELCLRCSSPLRVEEHTTMQGPNGLLRVVKLGCRGCGAERTQYFRIVSSYLN